MKTFKGIIKFVLIFAAVFAVVFTIFNYPAVSADIKYYWNAIFHKNQISQNLYLPNFQSSQNNNQSSTQSNSKNQSQPSSAQYNLANNHIIIPKLNLNIPIVWNSPESDFMKNLKYGVVHYQGTAHPGENGNIFIAGHSSSYWWERGPYSSIFSVIGRLNNGDKIYITYNNKIYAYQVFDKFIVKPNQVEVMKPTQTPTLTLMTCTPVGTALNRLIIRSNQVMP